MGCFKFVKHLLKGTKLSSSQTIATGISIATTIATVATRITIHDTSNGAPVDDIDTDVARPIVRVHEEDCSLHLYKPFSRDVIVPPVNGHTRWRYPTCKVRHQAASNEALRATSQPTHEPQPVPDGQSDELLDARDTLEPDTADDILARYENVEPLRFNGHTFTISRNKLDAVLHTRRGAGNDTKCANYKSEILIRQELEVLKKVTASGSPFLTPLLCSFSDDQNVYLVMRMYAMDILNYLTQRAYLSMHLHVADMYLIKLWAAEIVLGMQTLHGLGIMHRDLKMDNILITPAGHVAIADFGLSVCTRNGNPIEQLIRMDSCGTPNNMAPEQHWRRCASGYDYRVDIYAYGVLLLEMLLGHNWFLCFPGYDTEESFLHGPRPQDTICFVKDSHAQHLLYNLLVENPNDRLGWEDIKMSRFFEGFDWDAVARRLYNPRWTPCTATKTLRNPTSAIYSFRRNCDSQTRDLIQDTIDTWAWNGKGLGALDVDYECPGSAREDPSHGQSCTGLGNLMGNTWRDQCRYQPLAGWTRPQNHF
ncbi:hypothetical protein HYDPIDRAFT_29647 [Hydnomerulius pinastri MD-312]|uniref:non-specific serine/threonine protein kinase n=1 Tax=Hydnomerulius pinastri MD-312 TaxID=994086 RepID=A0A0C9WDW1_9AGAM|nr:hypothetical protein HYDPIDRAFT_29647 [Hydnomerulius pinastri MD-312]